MTNREKYQTLQADLAKIEKAMGVYLADESVDCENVSEGKSQEEKEAIWSGWMSEELWGEMYRAACMCAGTRAEEKGLDINALIGRVIY
uniref:Uncharacterized protein n=2 Tax=unclassified bacterial viruses TaxID=12333 RepID=A0AAU6VXZ7_9VIRU